MIFLFGLLNNNLIEDAFFWFCIKYIYHTYNLYVNYIRIFVNACFVSLYKEKIFFQVIKILMISFPKVND